jgi:hypothetical protein
VLEARITVTLKDIYCEPPHDRQYEVELISLIKDLVRIGGKPEDFYHPSWVLARVVSRIEQDA